MILEIASTLFILILLLLLLSSGFWIAITLLTIGGVTMLIFSSAPLGNIMATTSWGSSNSWALAALPLFIWMGEILFHSKFSSNLFSALTPWVNKLPGKLLHVNVLGCAIFAAVSGSSAATAATIGKISLPELKKLGYPKNMLLGTLAGSATLGLLIPPSIILIVYGVATELSIARLFIAGIIPGLILVALFIGYVMAWSLVNSKKIPSPKTVISWKNKFLLTAKLIPAMLLMVGIIGSVYLGIASPTDAAAVGVVLALLISFMGGDLNRKSFLAALLNATKTSCMIAFILTGAAFLTVAMAFSGIPMNLATWIGQLGLSNGQLLAAFTVFFVIMGCFLDGISIVVLTTSVIMPMVQQAGIDLIWFGIFIVIVVEMSQITPPVGFNLFVIKGLTGENMLVIAKSALPFFLLLLLAVIIIVLVPESATYLPNLMAKK